MSYQLIFLYQAELDLKELKSYIIKNFSQENWQSCYAKLKESLNNLKSFPQAGSIPPELEELNLSQYRQIVSGMNRIIYEIRQENIYIHIICDCRKNMQSLLTRRLLR